MRKLNLLPLIALSLLLAVAGGYLYVRFRAWHGDEEPHVLWLLAIGIGTICGLMANHRKLGTVVVAIAATSAVACCLVGNFWIASLERDAIAYEFNQESVTTEEFFVSLEAYLKKYENDSSSPPFTDVAQRQFYSDTEWSEAEVRWNNKPTAEQEAMREKWKSDYESLHEFGEQGLTNVIIAPWNLYTYGICAAIAAGIVVVIQRDERRG